MSEYLIRQSDAIKVVRHSSMEFIDADTRQKLIEAIPTIEQKCGEWIRDKYWSRGVGMGEDYGFFYKCSLCEYEVESGYIRCDFNYCPNCGARMEGAK